MPTGEENCSEEEIVVAWGGRDGRDDFNKVVLCQGMFPAGGHPMQLHATGEGFCHNVRLSYISDIRPESFKLSADSREVRFDGGGADEMAHVDGEKAERIFGWADGEAMALAEG